MTTHFNPLTTGADVIAVSVAGASFTGLLPPTAALLSIIWLSLQIYILIERWIFHKHYLKYFKGFNGSES